MAAGCCKLLEGTPSKVKSEHCGPYDSEAGCGSLGFDQICSPSISMFSPLLCSIEAPFSLFPWKLCLLTVTRSPDPIPLVHGIPGLGCICCLVPLTCWLWFQFLMCNWKPRGWNVHGAGIRKASNTCWNLDLPSCFLPAHIAKSNSHVLLQKDFVCGWFIYYFETDALWHLLNRTREPCSHFGIQIRADFPTEDWETVEFHWNWCRTQHWNWALQQKICPLGHVPGHQVTPGLHRVLRSGRHKIKDRRAIIDQEMIVSFHTLIIVNIILYDAGIVF